MIKQLLVVYRVSLREMVEQLQQFPTKNYSQSSTILSPRLFIRYLRKFRQTRQAEIQNFADVNPSPDSFRRANSLYFVIMVYAFEKRELKFPAQLTFSSSLPPTLLNYPEKKRAAHQRFPRVEQNT